MNRRQRIADMEMAYLGKAWRVGFWGPRENPTALGFGQTPPDMDHDRVHRIHTVWLRVADQDEYSAALLKLHYRDEYIFPDEQILAALDLFSKQAWV